MNLLRSREIADYSMAPHHGQCRRETGAAERARPFGDRSGGLALYGVSAAER